MERDRNWHRLTNHELEAVFHSDCATGLSEAEAARRLKRKKNLVWKVRSASVKKYAVKSFMEFTTVLLVAAVLTSAVFNGAAGALLVCLMLILCRAARVAVYISAQRSLEKNARAALPQVKVVRGGNVRNVGADEIAPGDVIILDSGDTVPCDIRLTAADGLLVSEGCVTDNEGIVSKNSVPLPTGGGEVPITLRTNMLYATSTVISGFAVGIAVATGTDTLVCAREGFVELSGGQEVPVLEKLSDWSRICSLCLTAAVPLICAAGVAFGEKSLAESFVPCIAMAAACLSEYLGAVGAAAWAYALKSGKNGAEVMRSAAAAERAAGASTLILRSPSVLKSGKITLHSYYKDNKLTLIGTKGAGIPYRLLSLACYCTGTSPGGSIAKGSFAKKVRHTGVLPYGVIRSLWEENGKADKDPGYTVIEQLSAGEENSGGLDNVLLSRGQDCFFAATGKISRVLSCCTMQRVGNEILPLGEEERGRILDFADSLKQRGVTVCAVGFRRSHYGNLRRVSVLHSGLCFEGFFAVSRRLEEGALDRLSAFRNEGGRVVMFSDAASAEEDLYFCRAEGVFRVGDAYISAEESAKMKSFSPDAGSFSVICTAGGADGIRERLRFVKLCSDGGCAYIGCGVEDMWNMQTADVSFAVPSDCADSVPQALRCSADGIAVGEGGGFCGCMRLISRCRRALLNIRHMLKYLIVSHAARIILMLLLALTDMPFLSAPQLVFWGVILDLSVSLAIALVPESRGEILPRGAGAVPDTAGEVLLPTLYGALCAAVSFAAPFLARYICTLLSLPASLTGGGVLACVFASCMIAMPFVGAELAGGYGLFSSRSVYGRFFAVPFVIAAAGAVITLFTPLSRSVSGTEFPGWIACAATLIAAAILTALMSVVRACKGRSSKGGKTGHSGKDSKNVEKA